MKKILAALAVILSYSTLMAQTEFDALKYVRTDINGTARYMGMAGAFGALGGDASAIKDNPAALGIFRKSEVSGTANALMQKNDATWNDETTSSSNPYKTKFTNFSLVIASPTWRQESGTEGLLNSNWSFSFNRLKNYDRSIKINSGQTGSSMTDYYAYFTDRINKADLVYTNNYEPFDNMDIPWISVLGYEGGLMKEHFTNSNFDFWESILNIDEKVTPSYTLTEKGHIDEYSIGWAGNFSNTFYFGATANIQSINYTGISTYNESFGNGGGMNIMDSIYTKGSGINLNIGAIYRPTDNLRFGLSLHTPSILILEDNFNSRLEYDTDRKGSINTPYGYSNYKLQSPLRVDLSAAYIVGDKGLISIEYDYTNYQSTQLLGKDGNNLDFSDENMGMKEVLNNTGTLKIGGEYKLTDNFSVRAGYANSLNVTNKNAVKYLRYNTGRTDTEFFTENSTNYFTAGLGYRESNWFCDLAYVHKVNDNSFMPYNSKPLSIKASAASIITNTDNLAVTVGFKF